MKLNKIIKYIMNPSFFLVKLDNKGLIRLSDKKYIEINYKRNIGKKLNINNPKTFNEKLQWLKINNQKDEYTKLVDKYEVKQYIKEKIGEEYVIPTIGVYDKFEEINFDELPDKFVMKCTHDSGGLVICTNKSKLDIEKAKEKINRCLKNNYFYSGREYPYKNVKPRIIVEPYVVDTKTQELRDYKFFCFNGKVMFFKVDFDRQTNHKANYFDTNLDLLPFGEIMCPPDFNKKIDMPSNIKKMIAVAEKISNNIPFVRVDLYNKDESILFGECTFFPASGYGKFIPEEWDLKIGNMLNLGENKNENNNR